MKLRILLIGATGKLGSCITALVDSGDHPTFEIVGKITRSDQSPLKSNLLETDVVLDASTPNALEQYLPLIASKNKPVVICSTGHSEAQLEKISSFAETIPVLLIPNLSIGIHLLKKLLNQLPEGDYAIEERHHAKKKDSPSGTALQIASHFPSPPSIASFREGDTIGEHKVILTLPYETLEIKHAALSRNVFALGALKACSFLYHKPKGLYNSFYD